MYLRLNPEYLNTAKYCKADTEDFDAEIESSDVEPSYVLLCFVIAGVAQSRSRARDLGVPFDGTPGPLNAITDVKGVEVGHTTLISGDGPLKVGIGPVRTGVTAILPRGKNSTDAVFAGWFTLNGNGEMTGTTWVEESGFLDGPVMITNTNSVGVVRDATTVRVVGDPDPHRQDFQEPLDLFGTLPRLLHGPSQADERSDLGDALVGAQMTRPYG